MPQDAWQCSLISVMSRKTFRATAEAFTEGPSQHFSTLLGLACIQGDMIRLGSVAPRAACVTSCGPWSSPVAKIHISLR